MTKFTPSGIHSLGSQILHHLSERRLLHSVTQVQGFPKEGSSVYLGIDPTSDGIHIGHLLGLTTLIRFSKFGYKPIVLFGGATGLIGDPSFRTDDRASISRETVEQNVEGIKKDVLRILEINNVSTEFTFVNNIDWFESVNLLDFLTFTGSKFRIQKLLAKDSMKNKAEGLTFTELSYQLFQAVDFCHLFHNHNCQLQLGGSDQWGNIVSGIEYIHKTLQQQAFGVTFHLMLDKQGKKFGKSEGNPVWLDSQKTDPTDFYNYLLNIPDDQVADFLFRYTTRDSADIYQLESEQNKDPKSRIALRTLAEDLTCFVHGHEVLRDLQKRISVFSSERLVSTNVKPDDIFSLETANDLTLAKYLVQVGLVQSKNEVLRLLKSHGITANREVLGPEHSHTSIATLVDLNNLLVLKKGKRKVRIIKIS